MQNETKKEIWNLDNIMPVPDSTENRDYLHSTESTKQKVTQLSKKHK